MFLVIMKTIYGWGLVSFTLASVWFTLVSLAEIRGRIKRGEYPKVRGDNTLSFALLLLCLFQWTLVL